MTRRLRTGAAKRSLVRGATEADALAALLGIWNRHGFETFALNLRGPSGPALLLARELGWAWGDGMGGLHVTLDGVRALGQHLGRDLIEEERDAERTRRHWSEAAE